MASRAVSTAASQKPPATRRRLPAAQRRALILNAALKAFASRGYDGTSMDEIATAAGISKAVVYDHVASKRDLYSQLLDAIRDEIERTVEAALRLPGADVRERVQAGTEAIYSYVEQQPEAARLLVLELQGANVSAVGRELEERITAGLARTLGGDAALFDGHANRARQLGILAELLKASVLGLMAWWYRHPEVPRVDLVARTVGVVWPAIEQARGGPASGAG